MKFSIDPYCLLFLVVVIWACMQVVLGMTGNITPSNLKREPCEELYTFSLRCEPSNLTTLYMEVLISIVIGGFLAYVFYALQNKKNEKIDKIIIKQDEDRIKREIMAKKMIGENLVYQAGLLHSALVNPDEVGRIAFSGKKVTIYEFAKEGILSSNNELMNITNGFSKEINNELIEELIKYSSHITYLFKLDSKVNKIGLEKSKETIQKLLEKFLPEHLENFVKKTT